MLVGNYTVKMDEKGRIKLPATYRRFIEEHFGVNFYVTSVTGECAILYPMRAWLAQAEKLRARGPNDTTVKKYLNWTSFFGQPAEMDGQGRLLIHPRLRNRAELTGDVAVIGYLDYLEVWDLKRFEERLEAEPYTADDAAYIANLGATSL